MSWSHSHVFDLPCLAEERQHSCYQRWVSEDLTNTCMVLSLITEKRCWRPFWHPKWLTACFCTLIPRWSKQNNPRMLFISKEFRPFKYTPSLSQSSVKMFFSFWDFKDLILCAIIHLYFFVFWNLSCILDLCLVQLSGHLWSCPVLHRRNSRFLPGQRNGSCYAMQQDVVLFSGQVSEEKPRLESIPPPGPQGMEGDNEEGISGRKELQSSRTAERTRGSVFKEWVSVPVLPGENWREMLQSRSRIKGLTWLR